MNYLLDTNACIALMSPAANSVQTRFTRASRRGRRFYVSSVVAFELWYRVFKSARPADNTRRCEALFAGPLEMVDFDGTDAKVAGEIRAELERGGRPIGGD